jgi:flagellar basal-body rod protein FlgB
MGYRHPPLELQRNLMNEMSDAAIVAALRREMTRSVARQVAAAGNLANLETPGYRAREPEFGAALDRQLGGSIQLAGTHPAHLAGATSADPLAGTKDVEGLTARRDGNTVQLDRELLMMTQASGDFAKAQTALAAKFRLVRYALSEGR